MTLGRVPTYPHIWNRNENLIRAAFRVLGNGTARRMAQNANWATGRGAQLIAAGGCNAALNSSTNGDIAPGTSADYRFYTWPNRQALARVWTVGIATLGTSATGAFGTIEELTVGSGVLGVWGIGKPLGEHKYYQNQTILPVIEHLASGRTAPEGLTLRVANNADSASTVWVTSIACVEVPRVMLTTTASSNLAQDSTCMTGAPIYDGNNVLIGPRGVLETTDDARVHARRACLFSHFTAGGKTTTSGSFGDVYALPIGVNRRHLYTGQTTREIAYAVLADTPAATTGEVQLTTSGASDTETIAINTSGTPTWHVGTVTVNTEDPTRWDDDGGLRGAARETMTVQFRRTAGAGAVTFYGLCLGESAAGEAAA